MDRAYEFTRGGTWCRASHPCGVFLHHQRISSETARALIQQLKPKKKLPLCGELIILSERTDRWHVELVNRCDSLSLQRWEYS